MNYEVFCDEMLEPGTWVLIPFGENNLEFCVLERSSRRVLMGRSEWLVSDAMRFSLVVLRGMDVEILGKGKRRWWRCLLPFIGDVIFPYSRYRKL